MSKLIEAAARAMFESESADSWDDLPADVRAEMMRDIEPIVLAVIGALADMPDDERATILKGRRSC